MYRSGQRVVTQAIQKYLGSSYDVVKTVYDNLTLLLRLQNLADNADKVVDVADNLDDVTSVADNLTDVSAVADNIVAVTEVNDKVDDFNTKYLGSYASAPTVDGNGDPLVEGATYWDTTLNAMFVYTGSQWVKPTGTGIVDVDTFTGDGSTASFPLDVSPASKTNTSVFIDGVYQEKDTYSVSTNLITFNTAPNDEASIEVIVNEITNFITGTQTETHTLTSGQTVVSLTNSPAFASFHIQGEDVDSQRLDLGTDYTLDLLTNTITLTNSYPENTVLKMLYGYDDDISVELAPLNQAILDHVNDTTDVHPAASISVSIVPDVLASDNVQDALEELATIDQTKVKHVNTIAGLEGLDLTNIEAVFVGMYHNITDTSGGGLFVKATGRHNGGTFIDPARPFPDWDNETEKAAYFADSGIDVVGLKRYGSDNKMKVSHFGAKGYEENNDSQIFLKIRSLLKSNLKLILDVDLYLNADDIDNIVIDGISNLNIFGDTPSRKIFLNKEHGNNALQLLQFSECDDLSFSNFSILGGREYYTGTGSHAQFGLILRSCERIRLDNFDIKDFYGDNIYFGVSNDQDRIENKDLQANNCHFENGGRNNMSVIALADAYFNYCSFKDCNGEDPEAGVDLEPNNVAEKIRNVWFTFCEFSGNAKAGLMTAGPVSNCKDVHVIEPVFKNNGYNMLSTIFNTTVLGGEVDGATSTTNYVGGITLTDGKVKGTKIKNVTRTALGVYGNVAGTVIFDGVETSFCQTSVYAETTFKKLVITNSRLSSSQNIYRQQSSSANELHIDNNELEVTSYSPNNHHLRINTSLTSEGRITNNKINTVDGVTNTQVSVLLPSSGDYFIAGNDWKGWGDATPIFTSGASIDVGYGNRNTTGNWVTSTLD